jgi:hypothetical protein
MSARRPDLPPITEIDRIVFDGFPDARGSE